METLTVFVFENRWGQHEEGGDVVSYSIVLAKNEQEGRGLVEKFLAGSGISARSLNLIHQQSSATPGFVGVV